MFAPKQHVGTQSVEESSADGSSAEESSAEESSADESSAEESYAWGKLCFHTHLPHMIASSMVFPKGSGTDIQGFLCRMLCGVAGECVCTFPD